MNRQEPRHAAVTGASGGVAPAVITALRERGFRLTLLTGEGNEDRAPAGAGDLVLGADLRQPAAAEKAARELLRAQGPVDVLLNLAGGFSTGRATDGDTSLLRQQLDMNLHTAVNMTYALLPAMVERGSGFIGAVGAQAVRAPAPGASAYAASKAGLAAWLRSLTVELAPLGISCGLVIPVTAIDTPGNRAAMPKSDPAGWVTPAAVAAAFLYQAEAGTGGHVHELVLHPA